MKYNALTFIKYFLLSLLSAWIILAILVLINAGFNFNRLSNLFTSDNLPIVIGVFIFVGIFCGLSMGSLVFFITKNRRN